jgi:hypothetical protein
MRVRLRSSQLALTGSVCGLTATGCCCGRNRKKIRRRTAYAARIPNAIAPRIAQINIAKLNQSAIAVRLHAIACTRSAGEGGIFRHRARIVFVIVSDEGTR